MQKSKLESWSWDSLYSCMLAYKSMLNDFQRIKQNCVVMGLSIGAFESYYLSDMSEITIQLNTVYLEMERRKRLVGFL